MLKNLQTTQFKEIPFTEDGKKFEYVFLEPRGDSPKGFSVFAHLYKDQEAYINENPSAVVNIGFVELDIETQCGQLFNAMNNLAKNQWSDFNVCEIPKLIE